MELSPQACVTFLYKISFTLGEMELNAVGRHKFGYVQQSVSSRSRSDLDLKAILVLWRQYLDINLCEVSRQ